jgi:hypothetical protein
MSQTAGQPFLFTLLLVALVVGRFLARELRVRRMVLARIWIAPAILAIAGGWIAWYSLSIAPYLAGTLAIALVAAVPVGAVIGFAVAHFTTVQSDGAGTAIVRGSWITVAIWLGALALRMVGRFAMRGAHLGEQMLLNAALIAMLAVAIGVVRYRIVQAARVATADTPLNAA